SRSTDYRDKPKVDTKYFTDSGGYDMKVMIAGIRKAREIISQPAMSQWAGRELYPGTEARSDAELEDYIVRTHNTVYHPVGTVRMRPDDDPHSPLTADLKAKGVQRLRVVDAAAMPDITTTNPDITVIMLGERCADLIKAASRCAARPAGAPLPRAVSRRSRPVTVLPRAVMSLRPAGRTAGSRRSRR